MECIKVSVAKKTVLIALAAAVVCFITRWLPWFTYGSYSMSMAGAIAEKPSYFAGVTLMHTVGVLWLLVFFLTNHPKLSIIGVLPLIFLWMSMLFTASDYDMGVGFGAYVYILTVVVCIAMAFATKKTKKAKAPAAEE